MINLANNTSIVADNKVAFCGLEYLLTDKEAQQLKVILDGMVSTRGNGGIVSAPQAVFGAGNTNGNTKARNAEQTEKAPYVATKDFKPQFEIKEQTATDGTQLFCISRKNGWTKSEKALMNKAIKALKGIKEIEVKGTKKDKNGKEVDFTFKAWGYNTESTAKKHLKELPEVFTVAQLNGEA